VRGYQPDGARRATTWWWRLVEYLGSPREQTQHADEPCIGTGSSQIAFQLSNDRQQLSLRMFALI